MLECSATVFANLAWYRRTKDLVPLFDPKVNLFENSLLKILAQLHQSGWTSKSNFFVGCPTLLQDFFVLFSL